MNIVIDIGNTKAKLGVFDGSRLTEVVYDADENQITDICKRFPESNILISSVQKNYLNLTDNIAPGNAVYVLNSETPLPIVNKYATPHTLGTDRLAAAAGCHSLFPGSNCLSIDAGTCITYDYINAGGEYLGGAISPGPELRLRAMNAFTGRLPLLVPDFESDRFPGTDTSTSMMAGAVKACVLEMDAMINEFSAKMPVDNVLICGGLTSYFESRLKARIFAAPNLVLTGLNAILIHNVS